MAHMVVSVLAADRPGLTRALADAVLGAGGNWLDSHFSRLGGRYAGSVLVDIEDGGGGRLQAAVSDVAADDLEIRVVPADKVGSAGGESLRLDLVGQDRPGIVHQVSAALAGLHVNIEEFVTRAEEEPHTGGRLFHAGAVLRLPAGLSQDAVRDALEAISGEVMVDIRLEPEPAGRRRRS